MAKPFEVEFRMGAMGTVADFGEELSGHGPWPVELGRGREMDRGRAGAYLDDG